MHTCDDSPIAYMQADNPPLPPSFPGHLHLIHDLEHPQGGSVPRSLSRQPLQHLPDAAATPRLTCEAYAGGLGLGVRDAAGRGWDADWVREAVGISGMVGVGEMVGNDADSE